MRKPMHDQAVELLLASISKRSDDYQLMSSFFFGKPGEPLPTLGRIGTTIYYDARKLIRAALLVRRNGPPYGRLPKKLFPKTILDAP